MLTRTLLALLMILASADSLGKDAAECSARFDVRQLQEAYTSGRLTVEAFIRGCLERIERYEPHYNAFISMSNSALEEAKLIDRRRRAGERLGPLAGVPVIVKESIDVAGMPSTAAWVGPDARKGRSDLIPRLDAEVVRRLRAADAIIIGKGNMPAFSLSAANADNSWAGPTYNAVDRGLVPGGSSSGVATAVAAGFALLGVAVESGGSIQNPAAAQALVGVKPTFGLVPTDGLLPLSTTALDVIGPHAKSVSDAAILLSVLTADCCDESSTRASLDYRAALDSATLRGKRIGLYGPGWGAPAMTPATAQLYEVAVRVLKSEGAILVQDPFRGTAFASITTDFPLKPYLYGLESMAHDLDRYFRRARFEPGIDSLSAFIGAFGNPFLQKDLLLGKLWKVVNLRADSTAAPAMYSTAWERLDAESDAMALPPLDPRAPDLSEFQRYQAHYDNLFEQVMTTHSLDFLAFPQTYDKIPAVREERLYPVVASPQINILGLPAVTVPAGYHPEGAPFGLIFIGRKGSEGQLLAAAYVYEQRTRWRSPPLLTGK